MLQSADFRIIPHQLNSTDPSGTGIVRYLISYTVPGTPRFLTILDNGHFGLTEDEKKAVRFPSLESARSSLDRVLTMPSLQGSEDVVPKV